MKIIFDKHIKKLIILLVLLGVIVGMVALVDFYLPQERQVLTPSGLMQAFRANHGSLTASESNLIRSWMTFEYINTLFKLPSDYLKNNLGITDAHYPKISIRALARNTHVNESLLLSEVQESVKMYMQNIGQMSPSK
jgi:hypothetical protein